MKFSIITPTYNHAKFIDTTIQSVILNKNCNYELEYIIVDGNSTDDTKNIVKGYAQQINIFISDIDFHFSNKTNDI